MFLHVDHSDRYKDPIGKLIKRQKSHATGCLTR